MVFLCQLLYIFYLCGFVDLPAKKAQIVGMKDNGAPKDIDLDDLSNRLFFRLYQAANMMHKTGTRALDQTRMTTQQWAIIGALSREEVDGGIAVMDLAKFLLVSRQNLTGMLSRLEAQGVIERIVAPNDSRSRLIRLTPDGRAFWQNEMQNRIALFYRDALDGFSTTDKIHVIHYFDKLLQNMKQLDQDHSA